MASRFLTPFGGRGLFGRSDPFLELHREMNRLFDDTLRGMGGGQAGQGNTLMQAPRIDVHETGDSLEVTAELPGVRPEEVDLRLEGDLLTIRGEKRYERKDEQAHIVERSYGTFARSIQLPFQPNPDQVRADFEHGVLKITMPRQSDEERSRRIQIGGQPGRQTIEGSAQPGAQSGSSTHDTAGEERAPSGGKSDGS